MSEVARRANTLAAESQQHIRQEQYMHQAMPSSNIVHQQANLASHKLPQQISQIFLSNFERHVWPLLSLPHLSPARLRATPPDDETVVSNALTDIALAIGIQLHASSLTASQTANAAQGKIYRACFESDDTRRQQQDRQAEDVKVWLDDEQCRAYAVNMVRSRGSKIGEKSCDSVLEDLLLFHFYSIRGEHCAASDCAARARRAVLRLQDSWRGEAGWTENEARYLWRRVEDADWQSPVSHATGPYPSQLAGEPLVQLDDSPSRTVDDAFHALSHLLSRSLTPGDMPNDLLLSRFRASIPESLAFSLKNDWMDKNEAGATGWINETSIDRSQPSLKVSMCLGVCFARLLTAIKPLVDGYKGDGMTGEEPRRCYETASAMTSATILALNLFPDIAAEALRYAHHSVAAAWSMAVASKRMSSEVGNVLGKQVQDVRQLADLLDSVSGTKNCRFATLMRQAADFMEDTLEVDLEELAKQGKLRRLMLGDTTVSVPTVNPAGNPVDASTAKVGPTSR
ncbi:hypothetical protein FA10DRAFT_265857 [Acaromyces ingoldii]|uniref:Uncharacterized protein n=1 Tax=Acaromyces ingoldii TaxID=215250 RepID=A0A316YRW4_9BASI|nr:hypothetical protein FA10DRAFT_265857 [Acaromyces ingoldii]PWN92049.1 hypothetical protein FA10DRAFT_265857 [Acaromyces ingoldii]